MSHNIRALSRNLRDAGYPACAAWLGNAIMENGLPLRRQENSQQFIRIREAASASEASGGLVAVLLDGETGSELHIICNETAVRRTRPKAKRGRKPTFEGHPDTVPTGVRTPRAWVERIKADGFTVPSLWQKLVTEYMEKNHG